MYGRPADVDELEWTWVDQQLTEADGYWTVPRRGGQPHPRPVWGVWLDAVLYLSVGSPGIAADLEATPGVTVHLSSVTDVVIVEGSSTGLTDRADALEAYNEKYDWNYSVADYGPLTAIAPSKIMAWRSAGWAGRGGFRHAGRWRVPPPAAGSR